MPVLKTENPVDGLKIRSPQEIKEIRIRQALVKYRGDKEAAVRKIAADMNVGAWRVRQEARVVRPDLVEPWFR